MEGDLTATQHRYYEVIRSFIETKGYSPSYMEIARLVGVKGPSAVHSVVHALIDQGYLTKVGASTCGALAIVPDKIKGMENCAKGHPVIWYISPACPLCDTLRRLMDKQQGLTGNV
jgi:SOS-response transcriptional repressor LexA